MPEPSDIRSPVCRREMGRVVRQMASSTEVVSLERYLTSCSPPPTLSLKARGVRAQPRPAARSKLRLRDTSRALARCSSLCACAPPPDAPARRRPWRPSRRKLASSGSRRQAAARRRQPQRQRRAPQQARRPASCPTRTRPSTRPCKPTSPLLRRTRPSRRSTRRGRWRLTLLPQRPPPSLPQRHIASFDIFYAGKRSANGGWPCFMVDDQMAELRPRRRPNRATKRPSTPRRSPPR